MEWLSWWRRFLVALVGASRPQRAPRCATSTRSDCALCPGPRTPEELASCDRGG